MGPETVRTKAEILDYLNASFVHLGKAIEAIDDQKPVVKSSPISPLKATETTRLALTVEALIHAFDRCLPKIRSSPRVEGILPDEPQRSMGLQTLLESGDQIRCDAHVREHSSD